MATLVASMSDRVDGQTATLDKLIKTAAETRSAAFHAKERMDMAPVTKALSEAMDRNIGPLARELRGLQQNIERDRTAAKNDLDGFVRSTSDVIEQRRRQIKGLKTRTWIPFITLFVLVLVLVTAAITSSAMAHASGEMMCWMADGFWYNPTRVCGL